MADWYVSSAAWTAIAQFAASTSYSVGQIIRPLTAPQIYNQCAYRCTTAGTSTTEPAWALGNNATTTSGGATFTNVTGQSAYGWSAAGGTLATFLGTSSQQRQALGDRIFVSSDHSETLGASLTFVPVNDGGSGFGMVRIISVNRAGSVPPVPADELSGATVVTSAGFSLTLDAYYNWYWQGVRFNIAGTISFGTNGTKLGYYKNCAFALTRSANADLINMGNSNCAVTWDNTTVSFSNVGQKFNSNQNADFRWINTASAIGGTAVPTNLFVPGNTSMLVTMRGLDISALTTSLSSVTTGYFNKFMLDSCRIAAGLTRYATPSVNTSTCDEVELINCYDGTNVLNERHTPAGDITTDRNTYLTSGAQDDIGNYSLKLTSSSRSDFAAMPLDAFAFDVENTTTGSSKTATVEIVSSSTLNNNDIRLLLEYMGTSGNPIASFGDSLALVLTAPSALPSSSNTWTNPPSTPQKQLLQVTFTPQRVGRVRGLVRLGTPATTVWVNPRVVIA